MTDVRDERDREAIAVDEAEEKGQVSADTAAVETAADGEENTAGKLAGADEEPKTAAEETTVAAEPANAQEQQYEETFVTLEAGKIVKGRVVQISDDEVMVDVGYKSEGRIPLHELGLRNGQKPSDVLEVGQEIDVSIVKVEDSEGNVQLSKRRADSRVVWEDLEKIHAAGETLEATVTERVKGGLLVDVGVRGFVPASHVSRNYVENLEKYVGETLRLKVVEIDRQRNNVVLSHKVVLEEDYEQAKVDVFSSLAEGTVLDGVVRRITDFGAFVDIGAGVEGLLHVSEMAWSRVKHPSDVVKEGDAIKVMVLNVDQDQERISLSMKETLPDPWETVGTRYLVGEVVEGEVTRVVDFGAFVKLEDGIEGLVHISQMADHHVTNPTEIAQPGEKVKVKIVSLDERARRIGLSIREAQPRSQKPPKEKYQQQQMPTTYGDTSDSPKLGDVFKDLSSLLDQTDDDN